MGVGAEVKRERNSKQKLCAELGAWWGAWPHSCEITISARTESVRGSTQVPLAMFCCLHNYKHKCHTDLHPAVLTYPYKKCLPMLCVLRGCYFCNCSIVHSGVCDHVINGSPVPEHQRVFRFSLLLIKPQETSLCSFVVIWGSFFGLDSPKHKEIEVCSSWCVMLKTGMMVVSPTR